MKAPESIMRIVQSLPDKPGVYQYFDKNGVIIYVGKAKNLKKRVSSYFNRDVYETGKTGMLVRKIADIKVIVVDTEMDSLLLENNLIKKHQPRYNVMLKDDKTYPWMCIKNEAFPRVFATRRMIRDGSQYFGPYANVRMMYTLQDLIKQLFPLRNCTLNLSDDNISKHKFRVCLEYHIGNCKGPCEGLQLKEDYDEKIRQIKEILKGNIHGVINYLKDLMEKYSKNLEFENALVVKEKLELLENYKSKSIIVSPNIHNVDVFSLASNDQYVFVNYFKVFSGAIVQSHTLEIKKKLDEPEEELLLLAIAELRTRFESVSKEIILPIKLDIEIPGVILTVPKVGDKKHLLDLSEKNAKYYMRDKLQQYEKLYPRNRVEKILDQMKTDLRLTERPVHIECFDNSNLQGTNAVAAVTVFRDGKPSKKDYRHFNIKTVEGPDDFASMEEIVYRRYKRMIDEEQSLPQLIIIDGGKGQLSSALESLEKLGLRGKIGIIGIAKRLEEIYYPGDQYPLYLDKKGETLKVIQHIRDEAHRFGITHHRQKRQKNMNKSELSEIKGIGVKTVELLLHHFRSVKKIREASTEEIQNVIGKARAAKLLRHFTPDN